VLGYVLAIVSVLQRLPPSHVDDLEVTLASQNHHSYAGA
jgi:hypothetical protein